MLDFLVLALGHLLVLAVGIAAMLAIPSPVHGALAEAGAELPAGERAWLVGSGFLVGAYALTLLMRALAVAGLSWSRWNVGAAMLLVLAGAAALIARSHPWRDWPAKLSAEASAAWTTASGAHATGVERWLWRALLAWIVLRFALLAAENATRPLYGWDTFMQWATKARVWFETRTMLPFAPFDVWLPAQGGVYFDAAPHYPGTAPLWQVWSALLIGRWDDSHTNIIWWCIALALTLAIYGFLRGAGCSRLVALTGAWFVSSLPLLDVHVALAGYADLPIAVYITVATLAGSRFARSRSPRDLVLFVGLLTALPLIKSPGRAWALLLLPGFLVALRPAWGLRVTAVLAAIGGLVLLVVAQGTPVVLGYRMTLQWGLNWQSIVDAYFLYANWHLLWFTVAAAALLGGRQLFALDVAPLSATLVLGFLFLFAGFAFTNAAAWVEDQTTVNRATLHLAPLAVVWLMLVYRNGSTRLFASERSAGDDAPAPT
jgi:hypothetical protein